MNYIRHKSALIGAALFLAVVAAGAGESKASQWSVVNCTNGTIKATVCSSSQENIGKGRSHQWQSDGSKCNMVARDAGSSRMGKVTNAPPGTYAVKAASSSKFTITRGTC